MLKIEAIQLLGGSVTAAAEAIGVTYQAIDRWPDELPARIADRVQAALWRISQGVTPPPGAAKPGEDDEALRRKMRTMDHSLQQALERIEQLEQAARPPPLGV